VLNMHTHACPLYSLAKLLGLEFTVSGVVLTPRLPLTSFRFESPLLGLIKSARGYEGWYNPSTRNTWSVRLSLRSEEFKRFQKIEVNGNRIHPRIAEGSVEIRGVGGDGSPVRWSMLAG
jgi:hypothetical protein